MTRRETNRAFEMAEEGMITWEQLATMALNYMSESDVADMLDANELSERFVEHDPEEEVDPDNWDYS